jgi:uncharacterized protein
MAARSYPEGIPCWVDAIGPDPERARHFYARVLGWATEPLGSQDGENPYFVGTLGGMAVGGIGPAEGEQARWTTYMAVDDLERVCARIGEAGGRLLSGPEEAGRHGRAARCADPEGAVFGLWQARETAGVEVTRVPGAWDVSDLHTDDEAADRFYGAVFGWTLDTVDIGAGEWASMFRARGDRRRTADDDPNDRDGGGHTPRGADDAIGWLAPLEPEDPGPHWRVSFTIGDRDGATTIAERLGGEIISTRDTRWTRSAVVRDPGGALLTLNQALSGR